MDQLLNPATWARTPVESSVMIVEVAMKLKVAKTVMMVVAH